MGIFLCPPWKNFRDLKVNWVFLIIRYLLIPRAFQSVFKKISSTLIFNLLYLDKNLNNQNL